MALDGIYNLGLNSCITLLVGADLSGFPVADKLVVEDGEGRLVTVDTGLRGTDVIFIYEATTGGNLVIKAGNGLQGTQDLTLALDAGINLIRLETGKYAQVKNYYDEDETLHSAGVIEIDTENSTAEGAFYVVGIVNAEGSDGTSGNR